MYLFGITQPKRLTICCYKRQPMGFMNATKFVLASTGCTVALVANESCHCQQKLLYLVFELNQLTFLFSQSQMMTFSKLLILAWFTLKA